MSGDTGVYYDDRKMLYMSGHVILQDGKGSRFISDSAVLNVNEGAVRGDSSVVGDSPYGHIEAEAYQVDQHGEHVVFTGKLPNKPQGRVHGRFVNGEPASGAAASVQSGPSTSPQVGDTPQEQGQ
jgi:hypothetical protein